MLALFLVPLIILISGLYSGIYQIFLLYIISGFGMAGVGMGIMHDALHGSYSKNKLVNKIMGYSIFLIGGSSAVWKIQHNILHHTYTNVDGIDDDIKVPGILRFSPHRKRHWFHRFQHFYVWLLYGLTTIIWATVKDFIKIIRYKKMGFLKKKNEVKYELLKATIWKITFNACVFLLPVIVLDEPFWVLLLAYLSMHFITGLSLSIIFQVSHVMPTSHFPLPNSQNTFENDWTVHQLLTTTNFSPNNRILSWLIGGLNFQIEHHLLPNVSHIHYAKLSPIVAQTAKEFGLPYNIIPTFTTAVADHIKMLRILGKADSAFVPG